MNWLQTIRFSLRQMRKRWVLTSAAAISLALCIGLNTAIFSVFNAVLLRSLPFPDPENVVEIYNTYPQGGPATSRSSSGDG
jgi:putative ABC transport system permease protein